MAVKRLSRVAREFNISLDRVVEFLGKKGIEVEALPNAKLDEQAYSLLEKEFSDSKVMKQSIQSETRKKREKKNLTIEARLNTSDDSNSVVTVVKKEEEPAPIKEEKKAEALVEKVATTEKTQSEKPAGTKQKGLKVLGKIEVEDKKPAAKKAQEKPATDATTKAPVQEESGKQAAEVDKPQEEQSPNPLADDTKESADKSVSPAAANEAKTKGPVILGKIDEGQLTATNRPAKKSSKKATKAKAPKAKAEKSEAVTPAQEATPDTNKAETDTPVTTPAETTAQPSTDSQAKTQEPDNFMATKVEQLTGPKVLGTMEIKEERRPGKKKVKVGSSGDAPTGSGRKRKKRKRIQEPGKAGSDIKTGTTSKKKTGKKKKAPKPEVTEEDIQKQIKETLSRLTDKKKSTAVKHRRQKREKASLEQQEQIEKLKQEEKVLKVTEFVSANELANMMNVNVNQVIATCMQLGIFVSINQRLDAETLALVADEFGYTIQFVDAEIIDEDKLKTEDEDLPDTTPRPPIVTVMGHVDHGKTSLLDYIRSANVIAGEAGGITQHIGAYEVQLENGKKITFLDTPGHEAFTAMRARGSKVTDIAVIVIAADDNIMPQTKEAINHAQAAGVPIIFAINKIDKPGANPDKIKEQLASMNLLVEDWGGKIQSQDISAKKGTNIDELMEKILLEAEMLELKANPDKPAKGTVLEAFLDKGKGYVANILVQNGTLRIGDIVLAGTTWGKIKAMFNERNKRIKEAGPAQPALILGLNSAPMAGDSFMVLKDEREAKNIASKREQLQREQSVHARKHITLDEIGRRLAMGDFKELNIIVKGDVDGSVEALSDALEKLSTDEIAVNIIHKSVGQINEADVILASASDAVIVGFQVRPSLAARKLAEKEQTDIRLFSVIYKAIEEIKAAIEGMHSPDIVEEIVANIEVRETFKISKVGTIAGCYVLDGKIHRNDNVRIIRDGIVIYTGKLGSLKRFKDDAKEVSKGFECGLNIENFNDIKVGDIIEGYREVEVKRSM